MKLTGLGKLLLFAVGLALVATALLRALPAEQRSWDGLLARLRGGSGEPAREERSTASAASTSASLKAGRAIVALRLHGSNTIGRDLAPALAERFFASLGATEVRRLPGAEDEMTVEGKLPGEPRATAIEIQAHGSSTAFADLALGSADIGMASRRIKDDERRRLAALGDLTSSGSEHVLGLDGLAIVVATGSPVDALTVDQAGDLFSGRITDWSAVGGGAGPVHVYARDDRSGTFDTFQNLVLRDRTLIATARRFEDSQALAVAVAADAQGIGFVGLAYAKECKALKIGERGAVAYRPTVFTVRTEDYALSRRLYLYAAATSANPWVSRFTRFALSNEGQAVVDALGFVGQGLAAAAAIAAPAPEGVAVPPEYARATRGATRMALDFRFESGSERLDNKALRDIGRLLEHLSQPAERTREVLLFGFADGSGATDGNLRLSRARAQAVEQELRAEGIRPAVVDGFGSALPVASNEDAAGRSRNRRVEIWLR